MAAFFTKLVVFIALVAVIAKTRAGHAIVVYALWLIVLFLVVTHAKDVAASIGE